ncbi:unnamed protein product [Gongylonema pulchrum]|uniref:Uncharacterized protein n=1 Tax=Gongylonema pulchrum TaxID=637853 RepID=A0A183DZ19_9BILA|nr:unnamed protein product [Gongylonema pulchrum]
MCRAAESVQLGEARIGKDILSVSLEAVSGTRLTVQQKEEEGAGQSDDVVAEGSPEVGVLHELIVAMYYLLRICFFVPFAFRPLHAGRLLSETVDMKEMSPIPCCVGAAFNEAKNVGNERPEPGYVVKFRKEDWEFSEGRSMDQNKLFLNVCHCLRILPPTGDVSPVSRHHFSQINEFLLGDIFVSVRNK